METVRSQLQGRTLYITGIITMEAQNIRTVTYRIKKNIFLPLGKPLKLLCRTKGVFTSLWCTQVVYITLLWNDVF